MTESDERHFEQILQHLKQTRAFDFTAYKRASLMRRVQKRMEAVGLPTFEAYFDYLQVHQDEFPALFNTILINVTGFFRDGDVWDYLRDEALPRMLANRAAGEPFRVWSAGCASGEEAYTILMLLAELLGPDAVRESVKIYATDADEEALNEARLGTYSARQVEAIPLPLLEKYFDHSGSSYVFKRDLRRTVIFGRHDLLQDAPISRVDLLVCRNTLMYFNADAQARILTRLFFSLNPSGHLLLGRAEMLFSQSAMFTPVELKRRLFTVVGKGNHRERLLLLAQSGREPASHLAPIHSRLREAAFETDRAPQIVVDFSGALMGANAPARERFGLIAQDVGRPLQDLEVSYRPAELRGAIARVLAQRSEVVIRDVEWMVNSEPRVFNVTVGPLLEEDGSPMGTRTTYQDVTELRELQRQLRESKQELETAYEELQSTNEELETTNEELQSTVEELETTNEELQSTNEELETMNEELQSTNEELQAINDELRNRSSELNSSNAFLESVFTSLRSAVIVLDTDLRIQVWNDRSSDMWGLRAHEAEGSHLLDLDVGFAVTDLRQPIRDVLSGTSEFRELIVSATNRRGKPIDCRISVGPLRRLDGSPKGAILQMEEHPASVGTP